MVKRRTAILAGVAALCVASLLAGTMAVANGAPVRLALQLGPAQVQAEMGLGRAPRISIRTGEAAPAVLWPAGIGRGRP